LPRTCCPAGSRWEVDRIETLPGLLSVGHRCRRRRSQVHVTKAVRPFSAERCIHGGAGGAQAAGKASAAAGAQALSESTDLAKACPRSTVQRSRNPRPSLRPPSFPAVAR
jgi:hypothetical protein